MLQNCIYIHYTVQEKLIIMYWNSDFYSICRLFTVEVWQRWKQLQSSVAETIASFYEMCNHFSVERDFSLYLNITYVASGFI
jgi:hypothetical protein